jgi:uncharacterized protein
MWNRMIVSAAMVICVGLTTAACGSDETPSDPTTPPTGTGPVGLANPASEFCVEQGGSVEIADEADGQVGYCNLPDGTRIDEWEYYRAEHPDATDVPLPTY